MANNGDAEAQFTLCIMSSHGSSLVPKDAIHAASWCRKAAEKGHIGAQVSLANMYETGNGVPKNAAMAVSWYRKAAMLGDNDARYALGSIYSDGNGVPKDSAMAASWYRKAAEEGHGNSQSGLGMKYFLGEGVPKDFVLAYMWINLAVAQGTQGAEIERDELERLMTRDQIAEAQKLSRKWKPKKQGSR